MTNKDTRGGRWTLIVATVFLNASIVSLCMARELDDHAREWDNGDQTPSQEQFERMIRQFTLADDLFDEKLAENRKIIVAHPKAAGPLVMRRLLFPKDAIQLSRATGLLIDMGYDREKIRAALKIALARARSNPKGKSMLTDVAQILGRIGKPEDAEALLPLLKYPDLYVRINAERALGKIAGVETAPKIEQILERRAKGLATEELRKDYSFREGYEAVAKIRYRALLKERD
jgi:hypothetical protein